MIPRHDCMSKSPTVSPASDRALSAFTAWLAARGHAPTTIGPYYRAARHLLVWLRGRGRGVRSVTREAFEEFVTAHLPVCHCPPRGVKTVRAAVRRFQQVTNAGLRAGRSGPQKCSAVDKELRDYRAYLLETCGPSESTCAYRERHVREFLMEVGVRSVRGAAHLNAASVADYIKRQAASAAPTRASRTAGSLHSYLRWLSFRGLLKEEIRFSVPPVRRPRLARIPRVLSPSQLVRLLRSFDRHTPTGLRDFAMALCMVGLGLRACEVVQLSIADIDWRRCTIRVPATKCRRWRLLPLPHRVGAAVGQYLRDGRPASSYAQLFVRHSVPRGTPLGTEHVRGAMRRAYARAEFPPRWMGTHLLRHTAATLMHQRGATLKEVSDVLGHICIDTTMVYTKVNLPALWRVALPWPEVSP
jgi:integrase/recombinase XerD